MHFYKTESLTGIKNKDIKKKKKQAYDYQRGKHGGKGINQELGMNIPKLLYTR